jgi:hypothetical protein
MTRSRVFSVVSLAFVLSINAWTAHAQEGRPVGGGGQGSDLVQFRADLARNTAHLCTVESILSGLETGKEVTQKDSDLIDGELLAYATGIKTAYDQAQRQAETAGRSKGEQGNVDDFLLFERTAQAEQRKVEQIRKRLEALNTKIKSNQVRFVEQPQTGANLLEPVRDVVGTLTGFLDSISGCLAGDCDLVSSAEASLAIPCVPPCAAKNWGACATCIISNAPAAIQAWNNFQGCWNGAHKPFQAWKRAGCVAAFLVRIA